MAKVLKKENLAAGAAGVAASRLKNSRPAGMPPIPMGGGGKPAGMPPIPKGGGGTKVLKATPTLWDKTKGLASEAYSKAKQKVTPVLKQFRESDMGKSLQKGVKNVKTAVTKGAKNPKVKTATKAVRNVGTAGGLTRLGATGVAFGVGFGAGTVARKVLDRRGFPGFDTPYSGQLPKDIERQGAEMAAPGIRRARERNRANQKTTPVLKQQEAPTQTTQRPTQNTTQRPSGGSGTSVVATRRRGTPNQGVSRNTAPAKPTKKTAVTKTQQNTTPSSDGVSMNTAVALTAGGIALGMLLKGSKKPKKQAATRPGNTYNTNYYFK